MSVGRNKRSAFIAAWLQEHGCCFWCRGPIGPKAQHMARPTVEHFFPRAKAGPDHTDNFVVAHKFCNTARGSRMPDEHEMRRFVAARGKEGRQNLIFFAERIALSLSADSTKVPLADVTSPATTAAVVS